MKKKKLSDSEIRLLLVFLAVLMFAGAYFLSFQKNVERSQEIEAKNEVDQAYVAMLESMVARRPLIEAETEEFRQVIAAIIAKYPPEVPTEKAIENVQQIENRSGAHVRNIGFSMDNIIVSLEGSALMVDEEGQVTSEGAASVGYRNTLSMSYEAGYSDFKTMIDYINGLSDRTTISTITAAYDDVEEKVSGAITVNMYYLTDTGKEYDPPHITGIGKGRSNIFYSGRSTAVGQIAESEGEGEAEDEE